MTMATDQPNTVRAEIDQQTVTAYAQLTGDYNPIHLDPEFASKTVMGAVIAHGTLSVGLIWRALESALGSHCLTRISLDIRFIKPVKLGEHLVSGVEQQSQNERIYDVWVRETHDNEPRIVGTATLID